MKYWHKKLCRITSDLPPEHGKYETLNSRIKKHMRAVEDLIDFAKEQKVNPLDFVRATYKPDVDVKPIDNATLLAKKIEVEQPKDKSKPEKPKITFSCLDLTFYEDFVDILTFDYVHKRRKTNIVGLKVNTVGKTIKQFRTFLRNRIRKHIIPPIDMDGWTILEEEVDAIYFSEDEVRMIANADLTNFPELMLTICGMTCCIRNYRNQSTGLLFLCTSKRLPSYRNVLKRVLLPAIIQILIRT